jgi:hypothetical protein
MQASRWTRRAALGAVTAAALTLGGAAVAGAATGEPSTTNPAPSGPVTITLQPDQVQFLCGKRLPKVEQRVTKLIDRINGGPDVKGSVANLKKKADEEKAAGRTTSAQLLSEKADRRAGRIDELNKIKGWVTDFRTKYCGGAK